MANIEELIRRVLAGLEHCSTEPETYEDCGNCPYHEYLQNDDDFCISRLCRDAHRVIVEQDKLLQQMGRGGTVIETNHKAVKALRYCNGHHDCYGADPACPYHETADDCLETLMRDLVNLIDGGDTP